MSVPEMCCVCGLPPSAAPLNRITWVDESESPTDFKMRLAIATTWKNNDVLVCTDCIKGIKRLAFSDLLPVIPF